jgi:hypothetical protein
VAKASLFPLLILLRLSALNTFAEPAATNHWAFQPVKDPPLPAVRDVAWPKTGVDRFILAQIEEHGLAPSRAASRRALLRRASFDLLGLPPRLDEMEAFLADRRPDAWVKCVDRLLNSPRYGERWGRHWLDVARYADSNGMDENLAYANAWRYRDYVIASFNRDKPYDRFLREQLAGDLLPGTGLDAAGLEPIVATGFLCIGPKMLAEDDPVKMEMDIVDEQVDTASRVFMGLTVGCGRCHDHKYDPVPTSEYYAMAGIFRSTRTMENFKVVARWQERPLGTPSELDRWQTTRRELADATNRVGALVAEGSSNLLRHARENIGQYLAAAEQEWRRTRWLKANAGARPDELGSGAIILEAERFQRGENVIATTTGYGEGIGVIYGEGGKRNAIEYDVLLPQAGSYRLAVRYAAAASRPVDVFSNGHLARAGVAGRVTGSWNPDTQGWETIGVFSFHAGTNVIRLQRDDCIPHFDKLALRAATTEEAGEWAAASDTPATSAPLVPEFVQQWAAALERAEMETNSVLHCWGILAGHEIPSGPVAERVLRAPRPTGSGSWAPRFAELFREALQLEATDGKVAGSSTGSGQGSGDDVPRRFRQLLFDAKGPFTLPKHAETHFEAAQQAKLSDARAALKAVECAVPAMPETMAVGEGTPKDLPVHKRGSHLTLGESVPRGFLQSIGAPAGCRPGTNASGRLELADWLTAPGHPLTARVMVNRIWHWHFGEGLVRTPDNFGRLGDTPTHSQLLDWLACRFVESGWSIKAMHRLLMNSAVYQQASAGREPGAEGPGNDAGAAIRSDPDNRWWARFPRRRLEAEAIRDSILAVSGGLDLAWPGAALAVKNREYVTSTANKIDRTLFDSRRRSVYVPVIRSALYDVFQVFDFADPSVLNGHRDQTTVAPQALFMLNSALVARAARALAEQALASPDSDALRARKLYEAAYSRPPRTEELESALAHLERYGRTLRAGPNRETKPEEVSARAWQSLCRALLAANEFIYLD